MGITRRRKGLIGEVLYFHHLFNWKVSYATSSRSKQLMDKLIRYRWKVLVGTRAMRVLLAHLVRFFPRKSSNHSQSLHRVCTSLHIAIQNKVLEWGKWKWRGRMGRQVLLIFHRGTLQTLFLRCYRKSWPFRKCRRTWEYQFRLNSWQFHLFFVVHLVIALDRIH